MNSPKDTNWPAGLAIVAIWLTVLVLGLWGGDIVSDSSGMPGTGARTVVPVVVIVAPCALLATVAIARRAFGRRPEPPH